MNKKVHSLAKTVEHSAAAIKHLFLYIVRYKKKKSQQRDINLRKIIVNHRLARIVPATGIVPT